MKKLSPTHVLLAVFCSLSLGTGCQPKTKHNLPQPQLDESRSPGVLNPELRVALEKTANSKSTVKKATPCPEEINERMAEVTGYSITCGAIQVPEFHDQDTDNHLGLSYLHVTSAGTKPRPLLVIEQGGPGGSSMTLAAYYMSQTPNILKNFDVLAVEQRGTKWTWPVATCDQLTIEKLKVKTLELSDERESKIKKECFDQVSKRMDITSISTFQIASDLVFSASEFGHSQFNYFGVSYGTLVGQYLLNYYPEHLGQTVFDSPVVPGKEWQSDAYSNIDHLFKTNMQSYIARHKAAGEWNKNYEQTLVYLKQIAERLMKKPIELTYEFENKEYPLLFNAEHYLSILMDSSIIGYSPENLNYLIKALAHLESDPEWSKVILSQLASMYLDAEGDTTEIMYQSIICREFNMITTDASMLDSWTNLFKVIPQELKENLTEGLDTPTCTLDIPASDNNKVISSAIETDHTVLVVGGQLDHVTSPAYVSQVATKMNNAQTHVFNNVGHGVFGQDKCITDSILNYLKGDQFSDTCP